MNVHNDGGTRLLADARSLIKPPEAVPLNLSEVESMDSLGLRLHARFDVTF